MIKKTLNIQIKPNNDYRVQLEKEVIDGLLNLDKSSINQNEEDKDFKYDDSYYQNLVFNGNLEDVDKIKIKIELIDSRMREKILFFIASAKHSIFTSSNFAYVTLSNISSLPFNKSVSKSPTG
jgi:organic radical activating enzyme